MTKLFSEDLKKGIKNAGEETIEAIWKHMEEPEKRDVKILCERKGLSLDLHSIQETLAENESLLMAVYNTAKFAEKTDLEILALR